MDAEPILGCRFVDHWCRPYRQRRDDLDDLALCPVFEGDEHSPAFARVLAQSIDPVRDPVVQVAIVRGRRTRSASRGTTPWPTDRPDPRSSRWGSANIGDISAGLLEFEGLSVRDVYFTGPLCIGPGIGLIFSMYRNTLNLNVGLSGRVMEESVARQYLEQADRELPFHADAPGSVVTVAAPPA